MNKIASALIATAITGVMAIPAPASAASSMSLSFGQQGNYVGQQCDIHPNWKGCDDWKHNRSHWSNNDYQDWYRWNRPNVGNVAAGLFGFVIGSAIASNMNNNNDDRYDYQYSGSHVARCEDAYRSYNPRTDKFLGYDGAYHFCRL